MPRIFISYRREDSIAYAGRIYDRLVSQFGAANVFMDVDTLEPGVDFVEVLQRTVASCDVFLAVLGMQWVAAKDEEGRARLSNPEDFVALEIGAALERPNIRVVPILVGGARMPRSTELPERLSDLTRRHALVLPDIGFHQAFRRLIQSIERAEQERLAREEAEGAQRAEQERLAREKAETAQRAEQEWLARERAEAAQRAEQERLAREKAEASQRTEQERLAREKAEGVQRAEQERYVQPGTFAKSKTRSNSIAIAAVILLLTIATLLSWRSGNSLWLPTGKSQDFATARDTKPGPANTQLQSNNEQPLSAQSATPASAQTMTTASTSAAPAKAGNHSPSPASEPGWNKLKPTFMPKHGALLPATKCEFRGFALWESASSKSYGEYSYVHPDTFGTNARLINWSINLGSTRDSTCSIAVSCAYVTEGGELVSDRMLDETTFQLKSGGRDLLGASLWAFGSIRGAWGSASRSWLEPGKYEVRCDASGATVLQVPFRVVSDPVFSLGNYEPNPPASFAYSVILRVSRNEIEWKDYRQDLWGTQGVYRRMRATCAEITGTSTKGALLEIRHAGKTEKLYAANAADAKRVLDAISSACN